MERDGIAALEMKSIAGNQVQAAGTAAVNYLEQNKEAFGVNPTKLFVLGHHDNTPGVVAGRPRYQIVLLESALANQGVR